MENSLDQVKIPTFHRKRRKTPKKSEMGNTNAVVHESLVSFGRRSRRKRREIMKVQEKEDDDDDDHVVVSCCEDHDDEKAEMERKILALQSIVPGGESLGVDKLFEETAGYILALQCQIKAMKFLASFLEGLEKEKRKFGG